MSSFTHRLLLSIFVTLLSGCGDETLLGPPIFSAGSDVDARGDDANAFAFGHGVRARGWVKLPITFQLSDRLDPQAAAGIRAAAAIWNRAIGVETLQVSPDSVDVDLGLSLYATLGDRKNTIYPQDSWVHCTAKEPKVLGTTVWRNADHDPSMIQEADIALNVASYDITDSRIGDSESSEPSEEVHAGLSDSREIVDATDLALHELGHALGLMHVPPGADSDSIMAPGVFIGPGFSRRSVSDLDAQRARWLYAGGPKPPELTPPPDSSRVAAPSPRDPTPTNPEMPPSHRRCR